MNLWSHLEIFNFKTFSAEILQIFELLLWKIDDFINSFWHNLTFNLGGNCASIIVGTKLGNSGHSGLVREMVGVKKFTCLSLSIIRCSDDLLAPKRFNFMVLNENQVPDKFKQPFPPYLLEALGIRCSSSSFLLFSQDNSQSGHRFRLGSDPAERLQIWLLKVR